jgi:hypothetical protein
MLFPDEESVAREQDRETAAQGEARGDGAGHDDEHKPSRPNLRVVK